MNILVIVLATLHSARKFFFCVHVRDSREQHAMLKQQKLSFIDSI
jgi:hypothetical protein